MIDAQRIARFCDAQAIVSSRNDVAGQAGRSAPAWTSPPIFSGTPFRSGVGAGPWATMYS